MDKELINHLTVARKHLIYALIGYVCVFMPLFYWRNPIYTYVAKPLFNYLPKGSQLIATDITSPFFVPVKLAALIALIISIPHILYQLWQFIAPALYHQEKRLLYFLMPSGIILFLTGVVFCYFIVLPLVFDFINHVKSTEITMMTDISKYLDFILNMFMVFGLSFELPIVIFALIYFNFVSLNKMQSLRKFIFVGVFILAAVIAPPDVLSQILLALPLYVLYELGMFVAMLFKINHTNH